MLIGFVIVLGENESETKARRLQWCICVIALLRGPPFRRRMEYMPFVCPSVPLGSMVDSRKQIVRTIEQRSYDLRRWHDTTY